MNTKHPKIMAVMGLGAAVFAGLVMCNREAGDERAWRSYCKEAGLEADKSGFGISKMLAAKKAYLAACKETRKDDSETYAELKRYEAMFDSLEHLLRVMDGVKAARCLAVDVSVPVEVRAAIILHWVREFARAFDFDIIDISDAKIYEEVVDACRRVDTDRDNKAR